MVSVSRTMEGSKLEKKFFTQVSQEIRLLTQQLHCTRMQAVFFSVVFSINLSKETVSFRDMSEFFLCLPVEIFSHLHDIEKLESLGLIRRKAADSQGNRYAFGHYRFYIPGRTLNGLILGKEVNCRGNRINSAAALLQAFNGLADERKEDIITYDEFERETGILLGYAAHIEVVKKLRECNLNTHEIQLFLYVAGFSLFREHMIEMGTACDVACETALEKFNLKRMIMQGKSGLTKKDLVELKDSIFRSDRFIQLTESAHEWFYGDIRKKEKNSGKGEILAMEINKMQLYYPEQEERQVSFLSGLLLPENFDLAMTRMRKKGMRDGFSILFYGPPGTGKTETAMQLARSSGRDIMMVDISSSKSMWFGESEKIVKRVFDDYREMSERKDHAPILLFNEADAIFGRRRETGVSPTDQTENTIQNILLQEMEELSGIMIATTNLESNFDKAFERRFLYKIRFGIPGPEARMAIWKAKIPELPAGIVNHLGKTWILAGGQIDNISRKFVMNHVLTGKYAGIEEVEGWIREETLVAERRRIGY